MECCAQLGLHDPAWATAIAGQLEELAREAAEVRAGGNGLQG